MEDDLDSNRQGRPATRCDEDEEPQKGNGAKWSLGVLNDTYTDEVPGLSERNAPLGLRRAPLRRSSSSLPSPYEPSIRQRIASPKSEDLEEKRTKNGKIILNPQPDESLNDPLNWSVVRRDAALLSLGFYCMVGGGMTTVLAPGFTNVSESYNVSVPQVALTTGLYMLGLGVGSIIMSPTAIAFGKRPVYLSTSIIFCATAVWCALSPSYPSLVVARVIQGIAVSPVECLPSATIAEIFFLHERAYRLGIYTLLLLGGKNLVPLVSAAVIQAKGWQWAFWTVAMIVGGCFFLLFFFVPETFWDRTPRRHKGRRGTAMARLRRYSSPSAHRARQHAHIASSGDGIQEKDTMDVAKHLNMDGPGTISERRQFKKAHFASEKHEDLATARDPQSLDSMTLDGADPRTMSHRSDRSPSIRSPAYHSEAWRVEPRGGAPPTPQLQDHLSSTESTKFDYFGQSRSHHPPIAEDGLAQEPDPAEELQTTLEQQPTRSLSLGASNETVINYTSFYKSQPPKTYVQTLKPYSGRLTRDNWFKVAARPFVLFAYPGILWSTLVYALSVGWLIVLSESVTTIFRNPESYNFSALQTGLVYISPFIGGVLGTAVAGKISDFVVQYMSKKNGGIYEPEFRLVMAIPVALTTTIGLMGYGWSAQERDRWIIPTIFFGIISFGCTLGSTTAITFAVDSYRQYAGEALVTLNFSKNVLHGLIFSLFFNNWLDDDGSKKVFLAIGGIQLGCLLFTIPMYIMGKRARMWTVRKNLMERF